MKQFIQARNASVPIIAVTTADPALTIRTCLADLKERQGKKKNVEEEHVACHDIVRGLVGVNERGGEMVAEIAPEGPMQTGNPTECLSLLSKLDAYTESSKRKYDDSVIFVMNADRYMESDGVVQAIWNLRDLFTRWHCTLVLLCPDITLPPALRSDVVVIEDPLPDAAQLQAIATKVLDDANLADKVNGSMPKIVDTLRALSGFGAAQLTAMSLSKDGVDTQELIRLKRTYIKQLPGVEMREDRITFDDIAGYDNVKTMLRRKIKGKRPPALVIWWDEFDRTIAANSSDTSGTTQDQVACLLGWQQDRLNEDRMSAMIAVGFPGCAKSAFAAAIRNEAACECMRWDMGGMKDSLVGSSEKRIRNVLKVTDSMSGGHILMIATCNGLAGVPAPVISRFSLGCYFFDLPTKAEGLALWAIKRKKYNIPADQPNPTEAPLSGREIQQCCFLADDLQIPLAEAILYITPYHATNAKEIEAMRAQAHNRWLSASTPGFYTKTVEQGRARAVQLQD